MEDSKLQWVGYVAIAVIVVSLASLGLRLTGYVADTAVVNITISSAAAINFTTDFLDFGAGSVTAGQDSATVNTEGTAGGGWSAGPNNLTLENIGNVNVSLSLKSDKNASEFIGGTADGGPQFQIKVINGTEIAACVGNTAPTYVEINTSDNTVCTVFPFKDSADYLDIAVQLKIPSDSLSGATALTSTITATGTT